MPPRISAYTEASKAVFEVFDDTTPIVEGLSIDEAFLDVSGLRRIAGEPIDIAAGCGRGARRVGLPITVGVARTKFLAKVASGVAKPDGLLVVPPDASWSSCIRCRSSGCGASARSPGASCTTAASTPSARSPRLRRGRAGRRSSGWHPGATCTRWPTTATRGRCEVGRRARSIGSQRPSARPEVAETIDAVLRRAGRPRRRAACAPPGAAGRTVVLRLRFDDFGMRHGRDRSPTPGCDQPDRSCRHLILRSELDTIEQRGLTLIGLSVGNLMSLDGAAAMPEQLLLPFGRKDQSPLDTTLDSFRERFGRSVLTRASLLGRHVGFETPKLPD